MNIVTELDTDVWRKFVDEHPHGNIFHTPEMFHVFERVDEFRPELWAAIDTDDTPLAILLPVNVTVRDGALRKLTTRAVVYGGVLCSDKPNALGALKALLNTYTERPGRDAVYTELRNLSDLSSVQGTLVDCGFTFTDHLNYLIRLGRPTDALFRTFRTSTQRRIRRALRRGNVTIREVNGREELALCYEQVRASYLNARIPLADAALFEAAFELLYHKGMVKFLLAWVDDTCAAASVELLYKDTIYGWYGGVDRNFSAYVPNELLMWHILKWGAENSFRTYDFGGAGLPGEEYGVRDFKAKFAGDLVNYGRNTYVHSRFRLALSKRGYALHRRLLRF